MITHLKDYGINWCWYYPIDENGLTSKETSFRVHRYDSPFVIDKLEKVSVEFPYGGTYLYYKDYAKQYGTTD